MFSFSSIAIGSTQDIATQINVKTEKLKYRVLISLDPEVECEIWNNTSQYRQSIGLWVSSGVIGSKENRKRITPPIDIICADAPACFKLPAAFWQHGVRNSQVEPVIVRRPRLVDQRIISN